MSKPNKQPIRDFMQKHYTDERLAELLAHAQDGRLEYESCCCFIGASTSDHAMRGAMYGQRFVIALTDHYVAAKQLSGAALAEAAYLSLIPEQQCSDAIDGKIVNNAKRRRILIPMVKAEMWRRAKLRRVTMAATPETTREPDSEHIPEVEVVIGGA